MAKAHVYANDLQVSCKTSKGKSPASFPNPCFSLPDPSKVIIPYANTAFAKDAYNTSKTVYIGGKPIMLKDKSYFRKSIGDEGAAGKKGIITGAKNGKSYYRSWSMDIKVEGYNVCRHTDMMTHNHNPQPGNTGPWTFLSKSDKTSCEDEKKKVDDECEEGLSKSKKERFLRTQIRRYEKKQKNLPKVLRNKRKPSMRPKTWKDKQCLSALINPANLNKKKLKNVEENVNKKLQEAKDKAEKFVDEMTKDAPGMVGDAIKSIKPEDFLEVDASMLCIVGSPLAKIACKTALVAKGVYDFIDENVDAIKKVKDIADKLYDEKGVLKNLDEKTINEMREQLTEDMVKEVKANKCLQARKCILVPYKPKLTGESSKFDGYTVKERKPGANTDIRTALGLGYSEGCCPGQTGHHMIPRSWAKSACPNYNHNEAPVICTEGATQHEGTHGGYHTELDGIVAKKYNLNKTSQTKNIPKEDAIDHAVKAHQQLYPQANDCTFCFGEDPCSEKCLKKQLENFYGKCKKDFTAKLITGNQDGTGTDTRRE